MDDAEVEENLFAAGDAKLHGEMCRKLSSIVSRVLGIFPILEGTRPGSKSGIQALCSLHVALDRAKNLLRHCSDCSKLYLAVTGDSVLIKFEKSSSSLKESLRRVVEIVPEAIGRQIVEVVAELEKTVFELDSTDKQVGDEVIHLIQKERRLASDSNDASELEVFHQSVARLGIVSSRAALTERRALKKLIEKARAEDDKRKESIVAYLLHLMRKYSKLFRSDAPDDGESQGSGPCSPTVEGGPENGGSGGAFERHFSKLTSFNLKQSSLRPSPAAPPPPPPEELRCPISLQLMHDPVIISSGQTYERTCIEKWFKEGHRTCPKTQQELPHLSLTPNYCVKSLIACWCEQNGVPPPDLESSTDSTPTMNFGCTAVPPPPEIVETANYEELLASLSELGSEASKKNEAVERIRILVKEDEEARVEMGSMGFVEALVGFLGSALLEGDMKAQEVGAMALFNLAVKNNRNKTRMLDSGVVALLEEMIKNPATHNPAAALYLNLSCLPEAKPLISSGPAAAFLAHTLRSAASSISARHDSLYALYNLSTHPPSIPSLLASGAVDSLHSIVASPLQASWPEKALAVLVNLAGSAEGRGAIAAAPGMIGRLATALDGGGPAEREQAAACLLLLCDGDERCCHVVLQEGVIPALVSICANGSPRGKEKAHRLLQLFREQRHREPSPVRRCPPPHQAETPAPAPAPESVSPAIQQESKLLCKSRSKRIGRALTSMWKSKSSSISHSDIKN